MQLFNKIFKYFFLILLFSALACNSNKSSFKELSVSTYQQYWTSGIPSKLKIVANAAVNYGSSNAELAITKDLYAGNSRPNVNTPFLKLVYNPNWEAELSKLDRQTALALGLGQLVESRKNLALSKERHPALYYAILASSKINILKTQYLNNYRTKNLAKLKDVGSKFASLSNFGVNYINHPLAWSLAKFTILDFSKEPLLAFLYKADSTAQIKARLGLFLSFDFKLDSKSFTLLTNILRAKGGSFKLIFNWFRENDNLMNWENLSTKDKLRLYASRFPSINLNFEYLIDLMTFPEKSVALKAAIKINELTNDKVSLKFLEYLIDNKDVLDRDSLIFLLSIFSDAEGKQGPLFRKWFSLKPNMNLIAELIILRSEYEQDVFNSEAVLYLKENSYKIKASVLEELIQHNDSFVRAYAYSSLNPLIKEHKALIKYMINVEKDEALLRQLVDKLNI